MARGYQVGIASETKAFKQGVQAGVIEPLEDAQKELTEMGRNRGPDQLEQAMKDAQRATDDLKDETKRTADAIEDEYRDAYRKAKASADDFGDSGREGFGKVTEGAGELKQEIGQNLGEAVSSFKGDLTDLTQVGQDTLGGLAATVSAVPGFGIPAAIGLAAGAAGWGLITSNIEETTKKQEELNQSAADWASAYQDSAGKIVSAAAVVGKVNEIATDPEKYKTASENAKNWGVNVSTAMAAMAGDATALATVQTTLNGKQDDWTRILEVAQRNAAATQGASMSLTREQQEQKRALDAGKTAWETQNEAMREGQKRAQEAAGALYLYTTHAGKATKETDDLGNKIYELPDGKQIVVDAKTKTAYEDLDALERKKLSDKTIKVKAWLDTSQVDNWVPRPVTIRTRVQRPVAVIP